MRSIYFRLVFLALVFIYLVILAGSIVRMTGSGMGCPDWPKCFDQWIPPTDIKQLPDNYKEVFLSKRKTKLDKYALFLRQIGLDEVSQSIQNDPSLLEEQAFNATKTWIEYINRLLGFAAGNILLILLFLSPWFWNKDRRVMMWSFLALLFTSIQGWFGSIVVASNLTPWTISFHMLFALLIIAILLKLYKLKYDVNRPVHQSLKIWVVLAMVLSLVQIYLGTQVRQEIDILYHDSIERVQWISNLTHIFEFHRSFAVLVLLVNGWLCFKLSKFISWRYLSILVMFVLLIEVFSGVIMSYLAVPKFAQPIHLFFATLLFGMHFWLFSHLKFSDISTAS